VWPGLRFFRWRRKSRLFRFKKINHRIFLAAGSAEHPSTAAGVTKCVSAAEVGGAVAWVNAERDYPGILVHPFDKRHLSEKSCQNKRPVNKRLNYSDIEKQY
jgi:hypothetical protein